MSRYIDADMIEYFKTFNPNKGEKTIADMAWRSDIDAIPTADVVEVVRCNECKYYVGVHGVMGHAPCSYWEIGGVMWDGFCSYGERIEHECY